MRRVGTLPGLLVTLLLVGCTAWTNPTKRSSAFANDAAACKDEAAQAALTSGQFDLDQDNAYITCMRAKGWERTGCFLTS
jgi:Tfp pilus assembly protein PilX